MARLSVNLLGARLVVKIGKGFPHKVPPSERRVLSVANLIELLSRQIHRLDVRLVLSLWAFKKRHKLRLCRLMVNIIAPCRL